MSAVALTEQLANLGLHAHAHGLGFARGEAAAIGKGVEHHLVLAQHFKGFFVIGRQHKLHMGCAQRIFYAGTGLGVLKYKSWPG